jgi:C4-type Zn-finger protein
MTIAESIRSSKCETICGECSSAVMAPEFVEYFSEEQLVLNFWSCMNCGFRFETEERASTDVEPRVAVCGEAELFPESFFPSPRFE